MRLTTQLIGTPQILHFVKSLNGEYTAMAGRNGGVFILSKTGSERHLLHAWINEVYCMAWSPNSKSLAISYIEQDKVLGREDVFVQRLQIWGVSPLQMEKELYADESGNMRASKLAWSDDGRKLAAMVNSSLMMWDVEKNEQEDNSSWQGKPLIEQTIRTPDSKLARVSHDDIGLLCAAWHPTLNQIACGWENGRITLQTDDGSIIVKNKDSKPILRLGWHTNGINLSYCIYEHIYVFNTLDQTTKLFTEVTGWPNSIYWDDKNGLLQAAKDREFYIFDANGSLKKNITRHHKDTTFTIKGDSILRTFYVRKVGWFFSIETEGTDVKPRVQLPSFFTLVSHAAWSDVGFIAFADENRKIAIWSEKDQLFLDFLITSNYHIQKMIWHPSDPILIVEYKQAFEVYDIKNGQKSKTYYTSSSIVDIAWDNSGTKFFVASVDGVIQIISKDF